MSRASIHRFLTESVGDFTDSFTVACDDIGERDSRISVR